MLYSLDRVISISSNSQLVAVDFYYQYHAIRETEYINILFKYFNPSNCQSQSFRPHYWTCNRWQAQEKVGIIAYDRVLLQLRNSSLDEVQMTLL